MHGEAKQFLISCSEEPSQKASLITTYWQSNDGMAQLLQWHKDICKPRLPLRAVQQLAKLPSALVNRHIHPAAVVQVFSVCLQNLCFTRLQISNGMVLKGTSLVSALCYMNMYCMKEALDANRLVPAAVIKAVCLITLHNTTPYLTAKYAAQVLSMNNLCAQQNKMQSN